MTQEQVIKYVVWGLTALLLAWFFLVAWRDLKMLFERPVRALTYLLGLLFAVSLGVAVTLGLFAASAKAPAFRTFLVILLPLIYVMLGVGVRLVLEPSPGLFRVVAVARQAFREAWAARAWGVLIIWAIVSTILIALTRPFDESERIPEYIVILLRTQEFLVLIFVAVMACLSLPRERERRTIITTATKPVSRLELFLGKVLGFIAVGLSLLMAMGLASWLFLLAADAKVRSDAESLMKLTQGDVDMRRSQMDEMVRNNDQAGAEVAQNDAPIAAYESLRQISEEGALPAYNYITGTMQVCGRIEYPPKANSQPIRYVRTGFNEKVVFRFEQKDANGNFPYRLAPGATEVGVRMQFRVAYDGRDLNARIEPTLPVHITVRNAPAGKDQQEINAWLQLVTEKGTNRPIAYAGGFKIKNADLFFPFLHPKAGLVERPDVNIEMLFPSGDAYLEILDPNVTAESRQNSAFANIFLVNGDELYRSTVTPKVYGFEKRDKQQFRGPVQQKVKVENGKLYYRELFEGKQVEWDTDSNEVASWWFQNVKRKDIEVRNAKNEPVFHVAMELEVEKQENYDLTPRVRVTVHRRNFDRTDSSTFFEVETNVIEKRNTTVEIPAALLPDDGELFVDLRSIYPGHWISVVDNSVRLDQERSPFVLNLFKSELVIFVELSLLVMAAVACSVRLNWPVALLTTMTVYLLGVLLNFIREVQGASVLEMMGLNPANNQVPGTVYKITDTLFAIFFTIIDGISQMVPDFSRYDPTAYIAQSRNMPWSVMLEHVGMLGLWLIPFVALGYLMIRKQELA